MRQTERLAVRIQRGYFDDPKMLENLSSGMNLVIVNEGIYFVPVATASGSSIQFLNLATNQTRTVANFGKPLDLGLALSPGGRPAHAVAVPRTTGLRPYQLVAAPIRTRFRQFIGTSAPSAVTLITDPERPGHPEPDLLTQLYGLTRKEAAIAARLSQAKSVKQAADEMGIAYETARTHVRRIFVKTGASHQTELLLLLAGLPSSETN